MNRKDASFADQIAELEAAERRARGSFTKAILHLYRNLGGKEYADLNADLDDLLYWILCAARLGAKADTIKTPDPNRGLIFTKSLGAEVHRLSRALLLSDGWRCDACSRVFADHDMHGGEDCDLCEECLKEASL